jgi:DNA-binding phage protein
MDMMMTLQTRPWDAAELLETPADRAAYLQAYLEDGTPDEIARARRTIARSQTRTSSSRSDGLAS